MKPTPPFFAATAAASAFSFLAACTARAQDDHTAAPATATVFFGRVTYLDGATAKPFAVHVQAIRHAPAGCSEDFSRGRTCSGPHSGPVAFTLLEASCELDACRVEQEGGSLGDRGTSLSITEVRAPTARLRVKLRTTENLDAEGSLEIDAVTGPRL